MHPSVAVKVPSCPGGAPAALVRGHCHVPSIVYLHVCETLQIQIYSATEAGFGTQPIHLPLYPMASMNVFPSKMSLFRGPWLGQAACEWEHSDTRTRTEICHTRQLLRVPAELSRLFLLLQQQNLQLLNAFIICPPQKQNTLQFRLLSLRSFTKKTTAPWPPSPTCL